GRHAAAVRNLQLGEIDLVETRRVEKAVVKRVDAGKEIDLVLRQLFDEPRHIPRVRNQKIGAAGSRSQEEARRQREDMIQRQRADDQKLVDMRRLFQRRLEPGVVLQHVGEDVAM